MSENHLSSLQDIVRLTIRQELEWSERRFRRVTMSEDADGKPAELYGEDGKIYYRKAGGVGAELGTGDEGDARYVRKDAGAGTQNMRNDLHFINYQVLEFFDNAPTLHGDISVDVSDNFVVRSNNSSVLTLISAAGHIACSGDRLSDVGTPVASGDAVKVDANIHVPLAQLPLTSKGTVFAGNGTAAGVLAAGTNTHVLTLDSTAALGVKWAAMGGGDMLKSVYDTNDDGVVDSAAAVAWTGITGKPGLCQNPAVANLDMDGKHIFDLAELKGAASTDFYFRGSNVDGSAILSIGMWDYSTQKFMMYRDLDMGGKNITNAVFAGYALESWVSSNFATISSLASYLPLSAGSGKPLTGSLHMAFNSVKDLSTPTTDNDAARKKYVDDEIATCATASWVTSNFATISSLASYLPLAGGIMSAAATIDMNGGTIEDLCNIYLKDTGGLWDWLYIKSASGVKTAAIIAVYNDATVSVGLHGYLDMGSNKITKCKDIKGLATGTDGANRLALDFRGDANHRIYYTGIADNKLQYKTYLSHEFMIQSGLVLEVKSGGIELSGSIKLDGSTGSVKIEENDGTGDMEFTVASGDAFVFKTV